MSNEKDKRRKVKRVIKTKNGRLGQVSVSSDVSQRTLDALAEMIDAAHELPPREDHKNNQGKSD
jgi:hypothetical protein